LLPNQKVLVTIRYFLRNDSLLFSLLLITHKSFFREARIFLIRKMIFRVQGVFRRVYSIGIFSFLVVASKNYCSKN